MESRESNFFVIDSSIFVAFYHGGDSLHNDAVNIMRALDAKTLVIHPYVIQETATVLAYKFGHTQAKKFLEDISTSAHVIIPPVDITADITNFSHANRKMSFTDITLMSLAKRMGAKLVTFDSQML